MRESDNKRRARKKRMQSHGVVKSNSLQFILAGLRIMPLRGYTFTPPATKNQRQNRKKWRQAPHTRPVANRMK